MESENLYEKYTPQYQPLDRGTHIAVMGLYRIYVSDIYMFILSSRAEGLGQKNDVESKTLISNNGQQGTIGKA